MRNVDFNTEWVKGLTKSEFVDHCAQNSSVYGWSDLDAEAYWNGLHPTPVAETKPKKSAKTDTTETPE